MAWHNFLNPRKKRLLKLVAVFLVFILLPVAVIYAQETASGGGVASFALKVAAAGPILLVGGLISAYVNLVGLLALQMINVLLELAQFNNFVDFAPVVTGWTILRDVVNMSFIILLLVIAISTILGYEDYSYRRLLPRLVFMAVAINFSRTIVGLLIDAGQVFMLTFVNAFSGAAGGNFVNALKVNDLLSLGVANTFTQDISPLNIFGGYILAAIAITVTFIVMLTFVGVLVFRILTLWFLIIFSPIAFALSVWPSKSLSGYYGQWWSKLTDNIMSGPILAFFLWLALLIMNADYVTVLAPGLTSVGTESGAIPNPAGVTQLSAPENFASFLFGIATLLMALKMTQTMGVGFAQFGSQALSFAKQKATGLAKGAGRLAKVGALAGAGAVAGGAGVAARKVGLTEGTPTKEAALSVLTNVPGVRGWARGQLGKARAERTKLMEGEGDVLAKLKLGEQERVGIQRPPILTPDTAAKRAGQLYFLLTDKNYARELEKKYGEEEAQQKMSTYMKEYMETTKVAPTPEITRKAINIKNFRPDLLEADEFVQHVERMDPEDIKKITGPVFTRLMKREEMPDDVRYKFLRAADQGSFGLSKAAKEYRELQAKESAEQGGETQQKFYKEQETEFRIKKGEHRLRVQDIGADDVSNPLIAQLLVTSSDYSGELEALLKRRDTREALQKTLLALRSTEAATPTGGLVERDGKKLYSPPMLAMAENAVLAGATIEKAYRVDPSTAKFQEEADHNAYLESLKGPNKVELILKTDVGMLRVNNYQNEVTEAVVNAITKEDLQTLAVSAGKDRVAQQNLANIVDAMKKVSATNENAAKLLEQISMNPILYRELYKKVTGRKGPGGSSSETQTEEAETKEEQEEVIEEDEET